MTFEETGFSFIWFIFLVGVKDSNNTSAHAPDGPYQTALLKNKEWSTMEISYYTVYLTTLNVAVQIQNIKS